MGVRMADVSLPDADDDGGEARNGDGHVPTARLRPHSTRRVAHDHIAIAGGGGAGRPAMGETVVEQLVGTG